MSGLMPKGRKSVLADIVHDALLEACHIGVISKSEYRKELKTVIENCRAMRTAREATPKPIIPGPPTLTPDQVTEKVTSLGYLQRRSVNAA
jgi:hypothetical protein